MRLAFFDPGQLRHAMQLQEATETPDGSGGFSVSWNDIAFVWAHVAPSSQRIEDFAARKLEEASHKITIRHRTDVKTGQRFSAGGRFFRILSFDDMDGTRRYLTCKVREEKP